MYMTRMVCYFFKAAFRNQKYDNKFRKRTLKGWKINLKKFPKTRAKIM